MNRFMSRFTFSIVNVLDCFDRVIFKGYQPLRRDDVCGEGSELQPTAPKTMTSTVPTHRRQFMLNILLNGPI
jgi:hypothetical protein